MNRLRCAAIAAALLSLIPTSHSNAQSIAGLVINQSTWSNPPTLAYPGDGSSTGTLLIAAWTNTPDIYGAARFAASNQLLAPTPLPLPPGATHAFSLTCAFSNTYSLAAWIDANTNRLLDPGEPHASTNLTLAATNLTQIQLTLRDDSDSDSLPDWWEIHWFTHLAQTANDDPDIDGLRNLTEFRIFEQFPGQACPTNSDSNANSRRDYDEDTDSDGLANGNEQDEFRTRPEIPDTDDDGYSDGAEVSSTILCNGRRITSPLAPDSPHIQRSLVLTGAPIPVPITNHTSLFQTWTVECWFMPTNSNQTGTLLERVTQYGQTNFSLAIISNSPTIRYVTPAGHSYAASHPAPIPTGTWTHISGVWNPAERALRIYVNGIPNQGLFSVEACPFGIGTVTLGRGLLGYLDDLRVWSLARSSAQIEQGMNQFGTDTHLTNIAGLVAWFPFDDGGARAENFVDIGNQAAAIPGITTVTNHFAPLLGEIDSDADQLPDWWESFVYAGNANPAADDDQDNLNNLYEFYADTNPHWNDSNANGSPDGWEDLDNDGLLNSDEQAEGTDIRLPDTDDDGIDDRTERDSHTSPTNSLSPLYSRALDCPGSDSPFVALPPATRFGLTNWTLEACIQPRIGWPGGCSAVERLIEPNNPNYLLGVDSNRMPFAGFSDQFVRATNPVPADGNSWTYLAASYDDTSRTLSLYVNAQLVSSRVCPDTPRTHGAGPILTQLGRGLNGLLDEVRIWNQPRSPTSLRSLMNASLTGTEPGLIAYYRFDDGTSATNSTSGTSLNRLWTAGQIQDFAIAQRADWLNEWRNSATLQNHATFSATNLGRTMAQSPMVDLLLPTVQIELRPPEAAASGAQWRISLDIGAAPTNWSAWQTNGATIRSLAPGSHTIQYFAPPGWLTPTGTAINATTGATHIATQQFTRLTGVSVQLTPLAARSAGALWRANTGTWSQVDSLTQLNPGPNIISFKPVTNWTTPPDIVITLEPQMQTAVTGTYHAIQQTATAGAAPGSFNTPRGIAVDTARNVYVADSANNRIQKLDSVSGTWSVIASNGTGIGQFREPYGVTLDSAGNLYVSDSANGRVQKRDATNNQWSVIGSGFNGPFDLAVDTTGVVYVADHYNHTIRRRHNDGTWSTFVPAGFGIGFTWLPTGLALDSSGNLYVSDYDPALRKSRVQKFTPSGIPQLIAASDSTNAPFNRAQGLTLHPNGTLIVTDSSSNRILIAANDGAWTTLVAPGTLHEPEDCAIDTRQCLYVSDSANNRVLCIRLQEPDLPASTTRSDSSLVPARFQINWQGASGWFYKIRFRDTLLTNSTWLELPGASGIPGSNTLMQWTDTPDTNTPSRFYRISAY